MTGGFYFQHDQSLFTRDLSALAWAGLMCAEVPGAVAIKDARVVTVSGADLPKATVLLRDGLIKMSDRTSPFPPTRG